MSPDRKKRRCVQHGTLALLIPCPISFYQKICAKWLNGSLKSSKIWQIGELNSLGLPYTNIITRFCSITQPRLAWTGLVRVLASQRVGNNVSSVSPPLLEDVTRWRGSWSCSGQCLASWQGSGQGHGSQAVQAHHHLTSAHMPGGHQGGTRGSPGGHQGVTRGHQGVTGGSPGGHHLITAVWPSLEGGSRWQWWGV